MNIQAPAKGRRACWHIENSAGVVITIAQVSSPHTSCEIIIDRGRVPRARRRDGSLGADRRDGKQFKFDFTSVLG